QAASSQEFKWVQVSTPIYRPEFADFDPARGTYTYQVSWQGIPAAELQVEVDQDDQYYRITVQAKTYSPIDFFYKLRYRSEGVISSYDLMPVKSITEHRENSKLKHTQVSFLENGEILTVQADKNKPPEVHHINSDNFTLDPFSAAFLARSLNWEIGQTRKFDTFNGRSRYLVSLTAESKSTLKVNGVEREVWVVVPKVEYLNKKQKQQKLRSAKIYVSADKSREILQIVSEVFVGSVKTKMTAFTPAQSPAPKIRVARNGSEFDVAPESNLLLSR
ncbi:MAG: DUF3108 domain-containing protein, partial [Bdellovibrionales bacterium]|nr:DUF3108 domain-containing protein [Bdellovibrionales bacterium]